MLDQFTFLLVSNHGTLKGTIILIKLRIRPYIFPISSKDITFHKLCKTTMNFISCGFIRKAKGSRENTSHSPT